MSKIRKSKSKSIRNKIADKIQLEHQQRGHKDNLVSQQKLLHESELLGTSNSNGGCFEVNTAKVVRKVMLKRIAAVKSHPWLSDVTTIST